MGSQVPLMLASPNMEAKSQLLSLKKALKYGSYVKKLELDYFMQKKHAGLVLRVGSIFLVNPTLKLDLTLNTSPNPHLWNVLSWRCPCHTWDLGLGTTCAVVSSNFHAINNWNYMDSPQATWDPMWAGPKMCIVFILLN